MLAHRKFDITSPIGNKAREFILHTFMPDTTDVDVMVGYRADDSYFSFAEDFVNNTISLRDLNMAMRLGTLGEQVVLLSERSFECIEFVGYEIADYREYYFKRAEQHQTARLAAGGAHFCTPRGISGGQSGLGYWCYIFANG